MNTKYDEALTKAAKVEPINGSSIPSQKKSVPLSRFERFKMRVKNLTLLQALSLAMAAFISGSLLFIVYNYSGCAISPARCVFGL